MRRTTAAAVTALALILGIVALTMPSTPQHPTKGTDMAQPGILGSQIPPGEDHVMRHLADIDRTIRELTPSIARSIQPTVARLDAADVANAAQDAATAANVADIAANLASINDLIGNEVSVNSASAAANGFATTASDVNMVTASIPVPAGYSQALVYTSVVAGVYNLNGVFEYLYLSVLIAGVATSRDNTGGAVPGGWATTNTAKATRLTGLSGGSISLAGSLRTDSPIAASTSNRAYLEAIAIFLR
jgi:hypothetical protein